MGNTLHDSLVRDVDLIQSLEAVPTILEVICRTTGMGFAAVARVTDTRWIACSVRDEIQFGLRPGEELPLETTICNEIRQSGNAVIVNEVSADPNFRVHPTPALYGFQSYISVPIRLSNGLFFGTLCAIDPKPAALNTPATLGMFRLFCDLISFLIESRLRAETSASQLAEEQASSKLRDQFIAILGHDLRNPIAAIANGATLLLKREPDSSSKAILDLIQASTARMDELVANMLDLARGKLAGGLTVRLDAQPLAPVLQQVIAELSSVHLDHHIKLSMAMTDSVDCDPARIGQLLSNLLSNALKHGSPRTDVIVEAVTHGGSFILCVENRGPTINPNVLDKLFKPFFRENQEPQNEGLGLGLYIAAEIARAHGGEMSVTSVEGITRFEFTMPTTAGIDRRVSTEPSPALQSSA